ncbi:MAG TPA: NAD(P)/FAD-dependent oxidoreductase [Thermotogota bacterium]|nr:NAD(P)/FAD-dependent oxidoreductase [Thermotogota bacterium]HPJ87535.1 NAD(P)/FAD-dependent oxidoreductase [Thermotogota bacterium]HPR94740.1 NAD(P)/FAD-dependent oxidoreductase [Thermotogota bacterium]
MQAVVVGAGVVGSLIARELTKYNVNVTLIEKEEDAGWGVTKANSAVIHGGYDDPPETIRGRFAAKGNQMYTELSKELGFDLKRIGSYVLAFNETDRPYLEELLEKAEKNGVPGCEIHDRNLILQKNPNINKEVIAGFWCPTAGITEPWMVAISAVENAVLNGMDFRPGEKVLEVITDGKNGRKSVSGVKTDKGLYPCDILVNAAGLFADEIAEMAGADCPKLHPRKGEYILLDKKLGKIVTNILFPVPSAVSKGILVLPTVDGGILLGPTAWDMERDQKQDTSTTSEGLAEVKAKTTEMVENLDFSATVKIFAGLRPESPQKDFTIGSTNIYGFINAAAMRSPGLTAAPAIAKHIVEEVLIKELAFDINTRDDFDPILPPYPTLSEDDPEVWAEMVKKNSDFGKVVCVCNKITEAQIIEAIKRGARTVDGVKFRTRASFGRCQGGFCLPRITEIISRELNIPMNKVKFRSGNTELLSGKVRK